MSTSGRCPTEQQLAAFVEGRLDTGQRDLLGQHVDTCRLCFDMVATLARVVDVAPGALPEDLRDRVSAFPAPTWRRSVPALAAAAAMVVSVVWWQGTSKQGAPDPGASRPLTPVDEVRRGASPAAVLVEQPVDGSKVGRSMDLRWTGPTDAVYYEVQIADAGGDLIWSGRSPAGSSQMQVDVNLPPGQRVYLWVKAMLPAGRSVSSDVVELLVEGGP